MRGRDGDPARGGEAAVAAELGGLLAHLALEGAVDGEEGGVADLEVEDFALAPRVRGQGVELVDFVVGAQGADGAFDSCGAELGALRE